MIKPKTERIIAMVNRYILMASDKLLSMTSTSRENRFVMRPKGVVSKKDIGARSARVIALFNMVLLALVPMNVRKTENRNIVRACEKPRAAYTPIYTPLE